jgi:hypothetical protein
MSMRLIIAAALVLSIVTGLNREVRAADACKECGDHRARCMKNYPGPTCKTDYDICIKACRKK